MAAALRLHHMGFVVADIATAMPAFVHSMAAEWDGKIFDDPLQKANLYADTTVREIQNRLQARLTNWYVDTSGVPPLKRDPRGAPVLDRPAELSHVDLPSTLLDH